MRVGWSCIVTSRPGLPVGIYRTSVAEGSQGCLPVWFGAADRTAVRPLFR